MPGQGRLGDKASVPIDSHGCPGCPHPGVGPAIAGSPDVNVNKRPALRVGDPGLHAACCGTNTWTARRGSRSVFINGKAAFRQSDPSGHCGGSGSLIEGSPNVIVGDSGSGDGVDSGSGGRGTHDVGPGANRALVGSSGGSAVAGHGTRIGDRVDARQPALGADLDRAAASQPARGADDRGAERDRLSPDPAAATANSSQLAARVNDLQARTLRRAALRATPFCEKCELARSAAAQSRDDA